MSYLLETAYLDQIDCALTFSRISERTLSVRPTLVIRSIQCIRQPKTDKPKSRDALRNDYGPAGPVRKSE